MMLGPTKKKVIMTGVICFALPAIVGTAYFMKYKSDADKKIAELEEKAKSTQAYVFSDKMTAGDVITSKDIELAAIKEESHPKDSFGAGSGEDMIGRRLRINAEAKTVVTASMFSEKDEGKPSIDERYIEYNMVLWPSDLKEGDYVDIRITMQGGEDYLVIAGKEVKAVGTTSASNTVFLQLDEEEIIRMTGAVIENYMYDGIKLYATKYVDPNNQLYDYKRIDYVTRFQMALTKLVTERQTLADEDPVAYTDLYTSGDNNILSSKIDLEANSGDVKITVVEADITTKEIADAIFLNEEETQVIRDALGSGDKNEIDEETLELYRDRLVKTRKDMITTYPVKENIALVLKSDPNIIQKIRDEYDIEQLKANRINLISLPLYIINDDGEIEIQNTVTSIEASINKEIETQKAERKEYLQSLLINDMNANASTPASK